jgi:hypothetical protein
MDRLIFGAYQRNETYFKKVTGFDQYHSFRGPRDTYLFTPTYGTAESFLQAPQTKMHLKVGDNVHYNAFSEDTLREFKEDMALSQLGNFEYALNTYRVMMYFGQLDIICNFEAGRRILNAATQWNRYTCTINYHKTKSHDENYI